MKAELRGQIYSNLNSKDTEELVEIWKTNDRVEWSGLAFDVLEEILKERLSSLPEQDEHILEKQDDEELEEWQAKILDSDTQPELYDTLEVIDTLDSINKVAKAAIVIYAFVGLVSSYGFEALVWGAVSLNNMEELMPILWNLFQTFLSVAIQIAVTYFSLKALMHILRILMEMELNSRK